ncbi:J domain-containing protein [Clostridium sp. C105KSO13]|uniref:J domain-containing protein n=1 Tax=Clostridium sp. C105KSO13 TaxID=1776045 RepID=UPI000740603E|nr:J domain-containing protein [Clostridium sp. C105KSO13]CUX43578.1 Chaperone protein DnaJ [Clostridium sp. C105KSO13]
METRTYYDILGVSREATTEDITDAKNALAKVYHPDANIHSDIDTTSYMQEILEAYTVLSNPDKRKKYNCVLAGKPSRVFRTYTVEKGDPEKDASSSFVTYWNAACKLNEIVEQSEKIIETSHKKERISLKLFRKIGKHNKDDTAVAEQLNTLSLQAIRYITILKTAEIPLNCWQPEAMNWVLVRWGQKQSLDYRVLFSKYEVYMEQNQSTAEKARIRSQNRHFYNNLQRLLSYASGILDSVFMNL